VVKSTRRYHNLAASGSAAYDTTTFSYDTVGRLFRTTDPVGTITQREYDVLDRVTRVSIGTDGGTPGNLRAVSEYFYDSGGTATQGFGDGNLTLERQHVDASTFRDTRRVYDARNRLIKVVNPLPPHVFMAYDNLDRVTEVATFASEPSAINTPVADRASYERRLYSQRGLLYRREIAIDPTAATPTFIQWNGWYDEVGRLVAEWSPSSPSIKRKFDELGRLQHEYVSDRGGDAAPGASGNYADARSLSGDVVVEQTTYRHVQPDSYAQPKQAAGLVDLVTTRLRAHDASHTGALDAAGASSPAVIASYRGLYYDGADRVIATAEHGSRSSNGILEFGGTAPTIDQSGPPGASTTGQVLVDAISYNSRGLVDATTDAKGRVSKNFYDDAGRAAGFIENWQSAAAIVRSDTHDWGWKLDGASHTVLDRNRAALFGYDGADQLTHRVAAIGESAGFNYQVTRYSYGVVETGTPPAGGTTGSSVASNGLLARIEYPSGAATPVTFRYNRAGEVVQKTDQVGTQRALARDQLGRVTEDVVNVFGTDIDTSINRIKTAYDSFGRIESIGSYSAISSTTPVNELAYTYDTRSRLRKIFHNPVGPVLTTGSPAVFTGPNVELTYSDAVLASGNISRVASLAYPAVPDAPSLRNTVVYGYGTSGSLNDRLSRVGRIAWHGSSPVYSYEMDHAGLTRSVRTRMVSASTLRFTNDRFVDSDTTAKTRTTTSGKYPGFDRFGRLSRQLWYSGSDWIPSSGQYTRPALFDLGYSYDDTSNPAGRTDLRDGTAATLFTEVYGYDGLDRLKRATRGSTLASDNFDDAVSVPTHSQHWKLDLLGNWIGLKTRAAGTPGDYDAVVSRGFDLVNQIISSVSESLTLDSDYDANGNLVAQEVTPTSRRKYIYDAWGRLNEVRFETRADTMSPWGNAQTRAAYTYFGSGQRATAVVDSFPHDTTADHRTHYYYDDQWRLLEERVDAAYTGPWRWSPQGNTFATSFSEDRQSVRQYVWDPSDLDRLVMYQRGSDKDPDDAQDGLALTDWSWALTDRLASVIGLAPDGSAPERMRYRPYGESQRRQGGDANGDGRCDGGDLSIVLALLPGNVSLPNAQYMAGADFNNDGVINAAELSELLANFNQSEVTDQLWADGCAIGYAGAVFDPTVNLHLMRHRWQDPTTGRFLSRDPAGYVDGMNLYEYAGSNAAVFTDPMGLYLRCADLARAGFSRAMIESILETQAMRATEASDAALAQLRLENSSLYKFQGGLEVTSSTFTFGLTDALGLTESATYQGEGYEYSRMIAGVSREVGLVATGAWLARVAAGGSALAVASRTGTSVLEARDVVLRAESAGMVAVSLGRGNLEAAALNAVGAFAFTGRGGSASAAVTRRADSTLGSAERQMAIAKVVGLETRGLRPKPGTRQIPAGIPDTWRIRPTKTGGGVKYYDPMNKGNAVRVMQGNPGSQYPNSQSPYVRWQWNGQALDINGNVVPKTSPSAHIPLLHFKFNPGAYR